LSCFVTINLPLHGSTGDVDFDTANQTATFPSGETTSNVTISVFNDNLLEGDEMFDLTLTVPDLFNGRISAGSRAMAVGDITDNTSESIHKFYLQTEVEVFCFTWNAIF